MRVWAVAGCLLHLGAYVEDIASGVLHLQLSITPAPGVGSRPRQTRSRSRKIITICSHTPAWHQSRKNALDALLEEERKAGIDLVVMCSCRHGGAARAALGSVAA